MVSDLRTNKVLADFPFVVSLLVYGMSLPHALILGVPACSCWAKLPLFIGLNRDPPHPNPSCNPVEKLIVTCVERSSGGFSYPKVTENSSMRVPFVPLGILNADLSII